MGYTDLKLYHLKVKAVDPETFLDLICYVQILTHLPTAILITPKYFSFMT